jgi:hypothetical protein
MQKEHITQSLVYGKNDYSSKDLRLTQNIHFYVAFVQATSNMIQIYNTIIPLIPEPLCTKVKKILSCKNHKIST